MTKQMTTTGTVVLWHDDEGWGALRSDDVPGEVWVHFSMVAMVGFRTLTPGDPVQFTWEAAAQDGYAFRAVAVYPPGVEVGDAPDRGATYGSDAYRSSLTIEWD